MSKAEDRENEEPRLPKCRAAPAKFDSGTAKKQKT